MLWMMMFHQNNIVKKEMDVKGLTYDNSVS